MKINLYAELIFIWKVSPLDSFWKRDTRELGNRLLFAHHLTAAVLLLTSSFWVRVAINLNFTFVELMYNQDLEWEMISVDHEVANRSNHLPKSSS